jgi:single-stranded-DNA-specific exonuclease
VARGYGEEAAAKSHLRPLLEHLPDPRGLADVEAATDRLLRAVREDETIFVHGDYDVDGIAATALYTRWLRRLGGRVAPFVPHRLRDGYDLGASGVAAARKAGASVLLTADCGIVAHDAVEAANAAGIDVIVTDHHTPGAELPPALAVVNPNRPDCGYVTKGLAGAGVAFKLCQLLGESAGVAFDELVERLDLVALATVADLVPLRGENRVLVRFGLRALARSRLPGLRALLDVTGLSGGPVGAGRVGFALAPRINAAGRIGEAADALELLLTDDAEVARDRARELDEGNRRRQEEDRRTLEEALDQLRGSYDPARDRAVVLAGEGWHPGVIGIVASRVVERIHRPVVMVAVDGERARGSARSIPGFHLYRAVEACAEHLERFGGHRQAAGMDLTPSSVPAFREAFRRVADRELDDADLRPRIRIDLELPPESLSTLDLPACDLLAYLGPHGIGNPRPVFLVRGARVAGEPRVVGRGHLKLRLGDGTGSGLEAIGFGLAEDGDGRGTIPRGERVDAVFQLRANEYRGRRTPQARLLDVRPAGTVTVEEARAR